jgi:hypothetical protein
MGAIEKFARFTVESGYEDISRAAVNMAKRSALDCMGAFSREEACAVVSDKGVDLLLDIQPPLETVLSGNGERLYRLPDARELERIREWRGATPRLLWPHCLRFFSAFVTNASMQDSEQGLRGSFILLSMR